MEACGRARKACRRADLTANDGARSQIITLASECARSKLVQAYVAHVLDSHTPSVTEYNALKTLTAEYDHTQQHVGGSSAPGPGWTPLELQDHLNFNPYKRDTQRVVAHVDDVSALRQGAPLSWPARPPKGARDHQPSLPGSPLNGPARSGVTQPP